MNNDGMFKNAFDKFIYLRATEVAITDLKHDPEYIALSNKEDEILRKIMELLPEEHRHLVFEREELSSDSTNLCIEQAYKYGLKDGVLLYKELHYPSAISADLAVKTT